MGVIWWASVKFMLALVSLKRSLKQDTRYVPRCLIRRSHEPKQPLCWITRTQLFQARRLFGGQRLPSRKIEWRQFCFGSLAFRGHETSKNIFKVADNFFGTKRLLDKV